MTDMTVTTGDRAASDRSLLSVSATAILASVTHAYDFGHVAFVAGAVVVALLWALVAHYRRTGGKVALVIYGLLNLWIIGGLGIVGGLWNHAVKLAAAFMHGGAVPPELQGLFMSPALGSAGYECSGVLTFAASVVAVYHGYRFARVVVAS